MVGRAREASAHASSVRVWSFCAERNRLYGPAGRSAACTKRCQYWRFTRDGSAAANGASNGRRDATNGK